MVALDGVSLGIDEGEMFGFLGPNGAGKTTTIKVLTTLLIPTSGRARVLGLDPVKDAKPLRSQIGFLLGGERASTIACRAGKTCGTSQCFTS